MPRGYKEERRWSSDRFFLLNHSSINPSFCCLALLEKKASKEKNFSEEWQ